MSLLFKAIHVFYLTTAPEIPGAIKVISISPTSATLSWDNPHRGTLDGFVVEINPPEGRVVENESPEMKWRLIENLTPGELDILFNEKKIIFS